MNVIFLLSLLSMLLGGRLCSSFSTKTFKRYLQMSRADALRTNLNEIQARINQAALQAERDPSSIRLVAVSKTKPVGDIQILYDAGHRHFCENYVQELVEKAQVLPLDIKWHFIGHLQSNKASKLISSLPNLALLETVVSLKLAKKLNTALEALKRDSLDVYLQVHTSSEVTKAGVSPSELPDLVTSILQECPLLKIKGVMTIGEEGNSSCFDSLFSCRERVAEILGLSSPDSLALSMGMSDDFEEAIAKGSTSVRVGSSIFGARDYSQQQKEI